MFQSIISQNRYLQQCHNLKISMLIPDFKITQTETHIVIVIRVPYVKVSACEFYIEQKTFKFYLKPYLLTLAFEQPLQEVEEPEKATYYHEKHLLEVTLAKKNKGEFFENLNLLSNILNKGVTKKEMAKKKVLVEVIGETEHKVAEEKTNSSPFAYGFCNNYQDVFKNLQEQAFELFSFNPEEVAIKDRCELSKKLALEDFDDNTYLFDKISNFEEVDRIVESKEAQENLVKAVEKFVGKEPASYEEFRSLMKIPAKELIYSKQDKPAILKQIVSIAVCYVYELICMEGELSVESARTISKTSGVFNCLADYSDYNLKSAVLDSVRRCVVYSLYKHLDIGQKTLKLLCQHLSQDLLTFIITDLRNQFNKAEPRYLLNTIFLDDFSIYLMSSKLKEEIESFRCTLGEIEVTEESLELEVDNEEMDTSNNNVGDELEDLLQLI